MSDSEEETRVQCASCGDAFESPKHVRVCGACMSTPYCSVECQRRDYKFHAAEECGAEALEPIGLDTAQLRLRAKWGTWIVGKRFARTAIDEIEEAQKRHHANPNPTDAKFLKDAYLVANSLSKKRGRGDLREVKRAAISALKAEGLSVPDRNF